MTKIRIKESELRQVIKEELQRMLKESLLTEHTNDMKPIICIVMGAPGVGKTTWIHTVANNFLCQQFRELDIDHTQSEFQLCTCHEVADELISSLSDFQVAKNNTRRNFESVKQNIQDRLNKQVDNYSPNGMYIDIMQINLDSRIGKRTLWEWAKNLSRITDRERYENALNQFKSEFYRTYFKSIFSSDFSKRNLASQKYDNRVKAKLSNGSEDEIDYNNDSICIATLGKSIDDIEWYVNQVKHTDSVICVVYLNAPLEVALTQNGVRDRHVSNELIQTTFSNIENTWEILKSNLGESRIWRLFRLEPIVGPNNVIKQYSLAENIPNPSMLKDGLRQTK